MMYKMVMSYKFRSRKLAKRFNLSLMAQKLQIFKVLKHAGGKICI